MGLPIDSKYVQTYIFPMPAHNRPAAKAAPLFKNQRNKSTDRSASTGDR
jgi:hypothetical protein